jgi:hypothetical protein
VRRLTQTIKRTFESWSRNDNLALSKEQQRPMHGCRLDNAVRLIVLGLTSQVDRPEERQVR